VRFESGDSRHCNSNLRKLDEEPSPPRHAGLTGRTQRVPRRESGEEEWGHGLCFRRELESQRKLNLPIRAEADRTFNRLPQQSEGRARRRLREGLAGLQLVGACAQRIVQRRGGAKAPSSTTARAECSGYISVRCVISWSLSDFTSSQNLV
jgi:hypothetical protein